MILYLLLSLTAQAQVFERGDLVHLKDGCTAVVVGEIIKSKPCNGEEARSMMWNCIYRDYEIELKKCKGNKMTSTITVDEFSIKEFKEKK